MKILLKKTGVTLGCLVVCMASLSGCSEDAPQKENPAVRYMIARPESVLLTTELPGRVSALMVSEVRPQVGGIIQTRLFEEGSDVKAGQVLYQIDPALFQATYNNAKAELSKAQANVVAARLLAERYAKIVDINAVSKQEYDDAVAAYGQAKGSVEAARQALETARINLGYTRITAPVSGRIGRSFVTPGALVTQNQPDPLSTIQQLKHVYVDVTQSSSELLKLRRAFAHGQLQSSGQTAAKVRLVLEDGSPYAKSASVAEGGSEPEWIEGNLEFSDVTIEQSTGVVNVRATFENPEKILLPGMYVRAVIEEGVRENAILVPQKTVTRDTKGRTLVHVLTKSQPAAFVAEAAKTALGESEFYVDTRYVTVDRDFRGQWLLMDGLQDGDRVLVDGLQKARPGQVVSGVVLDAGKASSASEEQNG
ncbi:MAG: efflux RND transporter periplasmic adaptor subunit [Oxalobacter sp.]|nr:efflux RND transporter periplasmic adaptor subunit [Oxalobacter sp.]